MPASLSLPVVPQLVANPVLGVLADVAKEPGRWAIEPKIDGILPDGTIETRNRRWRAARLAAAYRVCGRHPKAGREAADPLP